VTPIAALCRKEWRVAVDTPLGYVIAVAFLLAAGFFFGSNLFLMGQADMRGWFAVLPLLLMFFMPAVAMRMLADELRSGTFELLATMPLRTIEIVGGKYLAVMMQLALLLALTLLYPFSLSLLGNIAAGQIAASYVAALLLAAAYASICLFASALTRHAVIAYVVGFAILLGFYLLAQLTPMLSPAMQDLVTSVTPLAHYYGMLRGVIALEDVVYFVALSITFLALAWLRLESRRWR